MNRFQPGFITALGTPLTITGDLETESFNKQIDDQIGGGASGLLVMGSMGIQAYIRNSKYVRVAEAGAQAADKRVPVLVGVMDTSIGRVLDRIDALKDLPIDGVVATVPFYNTLTQDEIFTFFREISMNSPFPVYMYDLPVVTKTPIADSTALRIFRELPNTAGIKSGNLVLCRNLLVQCSRDDVSIICSNIDLFDTAYAYGITSQLDGMFACTLKLTAKLYAALKQGDMKQAASALDAVIRVRSALIDVGVLRGFTAAMNLLGFEGIFHPDYTKMASEQEISHVRRALEQEGML